jgi:hypothetical protein
VIEALSLPKYKKSSGIDEITAELIKYGGLLLKLRVLHLINMCWQTCQIPKS